MDEKQQQYLKERFALLPKPVQDAITSADVQKRLRELGTQNKLHLDQLEVLENEVQMALFGLTSVQELQPNLQKELKIDAEQASALAKSVSTIVFEPIRAALEKELAQKGGAAPATPAAPAVVPATPPAPAPTATVERTPAPTTYTPSQPSTERKDIANDPYREPPA